MLDTLVLFDVLFFLRFNHLRHLQRCIKCGEAMKLNEGIPAVLTFVFLAEWFVIFSERDNTQWSFPAT